MEEFNITEESPWRKYFISLVIILVALLSFGIGRLTSVGNSEPIKIDYQEIDKIQESSKQTVNSNQTVYASKNGKKYYFKNCSGINRISQANLISFASAGAAEASGFTLASGCQSSK